MDHTLKVGIHQPNFLPWFGYFYKIVQSDIFVFLDDVEHSKRSYTRRVLIHHPNFDQRSIYSRINLQKHSDYSLIDQLVILERQDWIETCLKQWEASYKNAPYYVKALDQLMSILEEVRSFSYLSEINIALIKGILNILDIQRDYQKSSELEIMSSASLHINIELCKKLGATHYLSGQGAKKYQSSEEFTKHDIHLEYLEVEPVFEKFKIPHHLRNKSIVSWFMFYSVEEISTFLHYKKDH